MPETFEAKPGRTPLERLISALSENGVMFREGSGGIPELTTADWAAAVAGCDDPLHEHVLWGAMLTTAKQRPPVKVPDICRNCGNDDWEKGRDPCPKCGEVEPVKARRVNTLDGWMDDPRAWHHRQRLVSALHWWGWKRWATAGRQGNIDILLHARLAAAVVREYCEGPIPKKILHTELRTGPDRWPKLQPHYSDLYTRIQQAESALVAHLIRRLSDSGTESVPKHENHPVFKNR